MFMGAYEAYIGFIPQITSLLYVINNKRNNTFDDLDVHLFRGESCYIRKDGGFDVQDWSKSFQTSSRQAYRLYRLVRELAQLSSDEIVYDLYAGTRTIAQFTSIARKKSDRHRIYTRGY